MIEKHATKLWSLHRDRLVASACIAVCFGLLLNSLLTFGGGTSNYNASVGNKVLLWLLALTPFAIMAGRRVSVPRNETILAFVVLAAVLTAAALNSDASQLSFRRLGMYSSFAAFGFVLFHALGKPSRWTVGTLLLAIVTLHAFFLAIALHAAMFADPTVPFVPRYFGNVRHLGYLGFLAGTASLVVFALDRRLSALSIALTAYALFGVLVLGSRGALIAWLVAVATFVLLSSQRQRVLSAAAASLGGAFALAYLAESARIFNAIGIFDRAASIEGIATVSGRVEVWLESWQHILQHPILGYGPEGFAIAGVTKGAFAQPHNLVLQVLLEAGLLGLAATFAFGWALFAKRLRGVAVSRRGGHLKDEEAGLVAIIAGYFSFGMIDGVFYHAIPLLCFVIVVSTWMALSDPVVNSSSGSRSRIRPSDGPAQTLGA